MDDADWMTSEAKGIAALVVDGEVAFFSPPI